MIGRRELPAEYTAFNTEWGAPYGHAAAQQLSIQDRLDADGRAEFGPFAFQVNSLTRTFEYPWAFHAAEIRPGMRVIEVGGGLSGFQFVLARNGCEVFNVDPATSVNWTFVPGNSWSLSQENIDLLNVEFDTDVRLVPARLQDAPLQAGSFDRVFCLSVLEHVDLAEGQGVLKRAEELLAPGGRCVLTIDLFLDLKPFGVLDSNHWGTNIDVRELVAATGLELVHGDRAELFGFPEFDRDALVDRLDEIFIGNYPAVSQALVLEKPVA
ncbi:class I SAM-dependent methyltransferase [Actinokineospora enzanensis]|uniref:class I SAM-dependent methyltransferase n=1 Tax=Actinokineospora enzanensis TaxID=155975 RepID=UPI00037870D4|nr:methyltransferase domain-containing protein [Actinokineospora enzanensis]